MDLHFPFILLFFMNFLSSGIVGKAMIFQDTKQYTPFLPSTYINYIVQVSVHFIVNIHRDKTVVHKGPNFTVHRSALPTSKTVLKKKNQHYKIVPWKIKEKIYKSLNHKSTILLTKLLASSLFLLVSIEIWNAL